MTSRRSQASGGAAFTNVLERDAAMLRAAIAEIEATILELPPRSRRDAEAAHEATLLLERSRALRSGFMRLHAQAVYDTLTHGRTRYVRLSELVTRAGDRFAGLVPHPDVLFAESQRPQAEKEGWDVDLGIVVRGFLLEPVSGNHLIDAMLRPTPRAVELVDDFRRTRHLELPTVAITAQACAAHVTLQRTNALNAENVQLVQDLETAVDIAFLDDDVRVGLLRGGVMDHPKYAGRRVFCSGIDLRALCAGKNGLIDFLLSRELGLLSKLRRGVLTDLDAEGQDRYRQKPWIGVVDGFAIGGGTQMLFSLDYVIAEKGAYFSLPAAQEGIIPGAAALRITRHFGSRLARRVILGGHRIDAGDPESSLICDEVCAPHELDGAIRSAIRAMDSSAVAANRMMLGLAEERVDDFRVYMAEFAVAQARRSLSPDVISTLNRRWSATSDAVSIHAAP
jgi:thioesterase DpgC